MKQQLIVAMHAGISYTESDNMTIKEFRTVQQLIEEIVKGNQAPSLPPGVAGRASMS